MQDGTSEPDKSNWSADNTKQNLKGLCAIVLVITTPNTCSKWPIHTVTLTFFINIYANAHDFGCKLRIWETQIILLHSILLVFFVAIIHKSLHTIVSFWYITAWTLNTHHEMKLPTCSDLNLLSYVALKKHICLTVQAQWSLHNAAKCKDLTTHWRYRFQSCVS